MAPAKEAKDAGKKLDTHAFQIECETEIQWKKLLRRDGLILIDVYSSWAGPCVSMVNILKKMKVELNDDRLWYGLAQTDDIWDLHMFHDQSEPTWLFIGGGKPVKVFRGSHVPKLTALIKSEFEHELLCMAGKAKRNIISIDDEVSRRRKAEAEAEALMKFMKDEDETAEEMNVARRESSQRLMHCMEPYTVLVVQNFLLETGALTEIRDELYGEFKIEQERTVTLDEKGARELFRIPYAIPDPDQPPEVWASLSSPQPVVAAPVEEGSNTDVTAVESALVIAPPPPPPKVKTIAVPVPPELIGDTHIMLLEAIDLKKMIKQGKKPATTSPLQTADDYLQVKVGPIQYADALEHAPFSLHAQYGKDDKISGVWCPRRYDDKRYVMINFFPRFVTEMLMPPPDPGVPSYMVAVFPASKAAEVNLGTEFHRQDVLARGTMKIPPDILEEMLTTSGYVKDSEAYNAKKELINDDVFVVSVNKTNSSLGLTIRSLEPVHMSFDNTAGKVETGKLFKELDIKLDDIPDPEDAVSKFLARSKKRPASITELTLAAMTHAPPSVVPSKMELPVENESEDDEGDEDLNQESSPPAVANEESQPPAEGDEEEKPSGNEPEPEQEIEEPADPEPEAAPEEAEKNEE